MCPPFSPVRVCEPFDGMMRFRPPAEDDLIGFALYNPETAAGFIK